MVRKIPKLLVGVVVGLCVTGCDETMPKKDGEGALGTPETKTQYQANPIKWITKLETENKALKAKLNDNDDLKTLQGIFDWEKENPQNEAVKKRIADLLKNRETLKTNLTARTTELCKLREMLGKKSLGEICSPTSVTNY